MIDDLNVSFIGSFLDDLESRRKNSARTRNIRLAAIHSFFQYVALEEPAHALLCQRILAMPRKRHERRPIEFLNREEIDALLAATDLSIWIGRRDRTMLLVAVQTGLRVSQLIGLSCQDVVLGTGAHIHCQEKGRKHRCPPLRPETATMLDAWLRERHGRPEDPLFPSTRGGKLSRDAIERLITKYTTPRRAGVRIAQRKKVSPHVLRHATAMDLLQNGVDRSVIALWLGHESVETTQIYLHADMRLKEQALSPVQLENGELLTAAETAAFEVLITSDQNIRYQHKPHGPETRPGGAQVEHLAYRPQRSIDDRGQSRCGNAGKL